MNIGEYVEIIRSEERQNADFLHLTANEAQMSETARLFLGSKLSERYYAGTGVDGVVDFGLFTQMGLPGIGTLVHDAERAAKKMLGARAVYLNCLSGIHAMLCVIFSTTNPGDTVMTLAPDEGGHFATTGIIERAGRKNVYAAFRTDTLEFDVEKTARIFRESNAQALYLDPMYYIKPLDVKSLRNALGKNAIIIYDASHTMGLIMGHAFQSPLSEGADVICANTHKTLPGPQKGMIAFKDAELGMRAGPIIKGTVSSVHTHHLIALAFTILEMEAFGKDYARQVIDNANALGRSFSNLGYAVRRVSPGVYTQNHQIHVFIDGRGKHVHLYKKLLRNNISTNFAYQPGRRLYIRIGTQEVTRRGMKQQEMQRIAAFIDRSLRGEDVREEVIAFTHDFSRIYYSFDEQTRGLRNE